ncbi:D-alanyl-D-alanine carboxypeptidase family protein [Streptomycetaceae bacterium NBC_01309]
MYNPETPGSATGTGMFTPAPGPDRGRRDGNRRRRRIPVALLWAGSITVSCGIGTAVGATVFGEGDRFVEIAVTAAGPSGGAKTGSGPSGKPSGPPGAAAPGPVTTMTVRCDDNGDGADIPEPDATNPDKLASGARDAYRTVDGKMANAGIDLTLRSGARSYAHQKLLWETEVACKGSEAAARKRVLPPDESSHVKGTAIDIAPKAAQTWLEKNGAQYGWCRTYDNEPWHFEYAASHKNGCPPREPHP